MKRGSVTSLPPRNPLLQSEAPAVLPAESCVRLWTLNGRINQSVLEYLDPAIWNAKPLGGARSIAAIVAHMHRVRVKWVRLSGPHLLPGNPARLSRARCSVEQAQAALAESVGLCAAMLAEAFGAEDARIQYFVRDGCAKPWPLTGAGGLRMLAYMLTHEAHHRGQICMIAHQLGTPLPPAVTARLWNWERLDKKD